MFEQFITNSLRVFAGYIVLVACVAVGFLVGWTVFVWFPSVVMQTKPFTSCPSGQNVSLYVQVSHVS